MPQGSVLQQPGPSASAVLVGARDALLSVDLATGETTTIADGVAGDPASPVRLGACRYGAWAGGTGAVVTACGEEPAQPQALDTQTSTLVFRTNRGQIVLNDRDSGHVWDIDSDQPTRLDNWDAFNLESKEKDDDEDDEREDQGDRRPPKAKKDDLGARPGRTTILHPLDNDTAPSGRLLAIRSVRDLSGADAQLAISPDGQTVQITLPNDATGATSFEYFIDDGRQSVSAHDTVRVAITGPGQANSEPRLRVGFEPRVWTVPAGGTIDVPVLSDWRDPDDGDPVSTLAAEAVAGPPGADTRITAAGAVRFQRPAAGGLRPGRVRRHGRARRAGHRDPRLPGAGAQRHRARGADGRARRDRRRDRQADHDHPARQRPARFRPPHPGRRADASPERSATCPAPT